MARRKKISAAAINIVIHPHSSEGYAAFIRDAYSLRRAIRVTGDAYMLISHIDPSEVEKSGQVEGTIARFTNIEDDMRGLILRPYRKQTRRNSKASGYPIT
jgi:hypothetical protein